MQLAKEKINLHNAETLGFVNSKDGMREVIQSKIDDPKRMMFYQACKSGSTEDEFNFLANSYECLKFNRTDLALDNIYTSAEDKVNFSGRIITELDNAFKERSIANKITAITNAVADIEYSLYMNQYTGMLAKIATSEVTVNEISNVKGNQFFAHQLNEKNPQNENADQAKSGCGCTLF